MSESEFHRVVRPYTPEERRLIVPGNQETPARRFDRLVETHAIDVVRYQEAAKCQPDIQEHFDRLINIGDQAITAWAQYYHDAHGVETGAETQFVEITPIPYDGADAKVESRPVGPVNPAWAEMIP